MIPKKKELEITASFWDQKIKVLFSFEDVGFAEGGNLREPLETASRKSYEGRRPPVKLRWVKVSIGPELKPIRSTTLLDFLL